MRQCMLLYTNRCQRDMYEPYPSLPDIQLLDDITTVDVVVCYSDITIILPTSTQIAIFGIVQNINLVYFT